MVRPKNLAQKRAKNLNNGKNNYKNIATSPIPQKKKQMIQKNFSIKIIYYVLISILKKYVL